MVIEKPYYPTLEAEIAKNGVKKQDLADLLGITPRMLCFKMKGQVDFWWKEVLIIQSVFPNIPPTELFEHNDE